MTVLWIVLAVTAVLALTIAYRRGVAAGRRHRVDPADVSALEPTPPAPVTMSDPTAGLLDAVRARLAAGRKIQAVKEVRTATGLGLKEAKNLVEAIDAGQALPPWLSPTGDPPVSRRSGTPGLGLAEIGAVARRISDRNGPIEAMKYVHEQTGMSLAEAKDYVDGLT